MKNLKGIFYIDFNEVKIDVKIEKDSLSKISAVSILQKEKFIKTYFSCLENGKTPFILNPNLESEDILFFSNEANASEIIYKDKVSLLKGCQEIPLGHITCSSGTTSLSKKIKKFPFDLAKIIQNSKAHYNSIGVTDSCNILFPLPLYHSFGLVVGLIGTCSHNHNTYLFEQTPSSEVITQTIQENNIDVVYLTPSLLRNFSKFLKRKKINIDKKIIFSIGAAHLYKSDLYELKRAFVNADIFYTYGLSELGPRVSTYKVPSNLDDINHHNDLLPIGEVIDPLIKLEVTDNQLEIESPFSYLDQKINTNDEVFQDEKRNIFILGRSDFMINFAGVNIYPEEVEARLLPHMQEFDFIVSSLNSHLYGEVPVLIIEGSKASPINKEALLEICSTNLPEHLSINQVFILESFPRTSMGKIMRKQLKTLINIA